MVYQRLFKILFCAVPESDNLNPVSHYPADIRFNPASYTKWYAAIHMVYKKVIDLSSFHVVFEFGRLNKEEQRRSKDVSFFIGAFIASLCRSVTLLRVRTHLLVFPLMFLSVSGGWSLFLSLGF